MLSRGVKIIIIIGVCLALIGGIVYVFWQSNKSSDQKTTDGSTLTAEPTTTEIKIEPPKLTDEDISRNEAKNLVLMFAERFGTYSADADFSLLDELQNMMTTKFAGWINQTYKKKMQAEYTADSKYKSVTVEALAVNFENFSDSAATAMVSVRSTKKNNGAEPLETAEKLKIELTKSSDKWLISGAYWQ
jgi:hypothetical protein